jgi:hypothetical protein
MMTDLWPDNIGDIKITPPIDILQEQASLLGKKTKNLVQAEVTGGEENENYFAYNFNIVAPSLENCRYRLLTIEHDIGLYPLFLYTEDDILDDIPSDFDTKLTIESEEEFMETLRTIFGADKTKRVISSLLSQSVQGKK